MTKIELHGIYNIDAPNLCHLVEISIFGCTKECERLHGIVFPVTVGGRRTEQAPFCVHYLSLDKGEIVGNYEYGWDHPAVVAVQPFSMVRPELVPLRGVDSPADLRAGGDRGCVAGFDPARSDAADAIGRTSAPVLSMHGTDDWIVPYWNSVLLRQEAAAHCELVTFPGRGHQSLWLDYDGELARRAVAWFDRWLTRSKSY